MLQVAEYTRLKMRLAQEVGDLLVAGRVLRVDWQVSLTGGCAVEYGAVTGWEAFVGSTSLDEVRLGLIQPIAITPAHQIGRDDESSISCAFLRTLIGIFSWLVFHRLFLSKLYT
jgi:hypothetical protein